MHKKQSEKFKSKCFLLNMKNMKNNISCSKKLCLAQCDEIHKNTKKNLFI